MPLVKIHNHTSLILNIAFAQVCPLHHSNEVKPFERLEKSVGAVWFTIECKVDNGNNRYSFARSALSLSLICSTSLSIASLIVLTAIPSSALVGGSAAATALIHGITHLSRLAPVLWPSAIKQICQDHGLDEKEVKGLLESVGTAAAAATAFGEGKGWIGAGSRNSSNSSKAEEKPSLLPPSKKSKGKRGDDLNSSDEEDPKPDNSKGKGKGKGKGKEKEKGKDKSQSEPDDQVENKDLVSQTLTNVGFASTTVNMIDAGRNMFSTLSRSFSKRSKDEETKTESEPDEPDEPPPQSNLKGRRSLDFGSVNQAKFSPATSRPDPSSSSFKSPSRRHASEISSPPVSFKPSSKKRATGPSPPPSSFKAPAVATPKDPIAPFGSVASSETRPSSFTLKTKTWRPAARAGGKEAELFQSAPAVPTLKRSPSTTAPSRSATTRRPPLSYKKAEKAAAKATAHPLTDERDARVWGHAAKWKSASSSNLLSDISKGDRRQSKKSSRYDADDDDDDEEWSTFDIAEVNEARRALGFKEVLIPTAPPPPYSPTDPDPIPPPRVGWKTLGKMLKGAWTSKTEDSALAGKEPEFLVETRNGDHDGESKQSTSTKAKLPPNKGKLAQPVVPSPSKTSRKAERPGRRAPIPQDAEMRVYCVYMGWSEREFSIREGDGKFELWDEATGEKIG